MSYHPFIFPQFEKAHWAKVDLGEIAKKEFANHSDNPLLNPDFCDKWVNRIAQENHADVTWGGHFEDRKKLWQGYYQDAPVVIHLGVDYNVPIGTIVTSPASGIIIDSWKDKNLENGWGGRIIMRMDNEWQGASYLIFGHLAHDSLPPEGKRLEKGDVLAITGVPEENGGWFPHLHVQCASEEFIHAHRDNLQLLDGYYLSDSYPYHLAPDPSLLVGHIKE
jgi:hypothetical protein